MCVGASCEVVRFSSSGWVCLSVKYGVYFALMLCAFFCKFYDAVCHFVVPVNN